MTKLRLAGGGNYLLAVFTSCLWLELCFFLFFQFCLGGNSLYRLKGELFLFCWVCYMCTLYHAV